MDEALRREVDRLAASPILLVASDFDGTLAPLAEQPELARADERAIAALETLAEMESTHVAVISGRSLESLRERLGDGLTRSPAVILVGGHGAELAGEPAALCIEPRSLQRLKSEMEKIAAAHPGAVVEPKAAGVAVHYRHTREREHAEIREAVRTAARGLACPMLRDGVLVIEVGLLDTDKGRGLEWAVRRVNAHATIFLGDDLTDEDAFGALKGTDVGVKVGPGRSAAEQRVADVAGVRDVLEALATARRAWLEQRRLMPIDGLALLSDQRSCALLDDAGRVVWMCSPRFDSDPMFADLLGGERAGYFEVAPTDGRRARSRGYVPDTMVLRTEYDGLSVTDYMDCSGGRAYQRAGRSDLIRVVEGKGRVVVRFSPRIDFGRASTRVKAREGGLVVEGSIHPAALHAPGLVWKVQSVNGHEMAMAEWEVDGRLVLELRTGMSGLRDGPVGERDRRVATERFWSGWAGTLRLPARHRELVRRGALVIKALCYGPSGAICAAGTTSLPEQIGGVRNWDYRFCWIRDAAMACTSLVRLGSTGHALKLLDWLGAILEDLEGPQFLRPLYTVRGQELGVEGDVSDMDGYGQSRPVRVGNGAAHQLQLDVFGVVADLIAHLAEAGAPLTPDHWRMLDAMVEAVRVRWRESDHGIWEVRAAVRAHVHSRAMCWFTVARANRARQIVGDPERAEDLSLADEIRQDVLKYGYDKELGSFTAAYGESHVDAATLLVGLTGLVDAQDERFVGTVEHVRAELMRGGTVLRYTYDDGLPGTEGGFHLCTGWLIESLHMMGRRDEAAELLEEYAGQAGPLGLYSEERCTQTGRALGNYPQVYSHLALINACCRVWPG